MPILPARTLDETAVFLRLHALEQDGRIPAGFAGAVSALCRQAAERLRLFQGLHQQFTIHDETHCLRVVQIMGAVLGASLDRLNAIEIGLLILSAYYHDQGMIVEGHELNAIRASTEWRTHEETWMADHPNAVDVTERSTESRLTPAERDRASAAAADLRAAMWTEFVRQSHAHRSAAFVTASLGDDPRLVVYSRSIAALLALLCESHVRPPEALTPANGFAYDELVGTTPVDMSLLAWVLRLADILDFDRERTPPSLYRAITFSSTTSLTEWEKHRSIVGWSIGPDRIVFAAECEHPAYERAIRQFMDQIDSELTAAHVWNRSLPSDFQTHELTLPPRVERDKIRAQLDPLTREPVYQYHDLEFSLSRDEVVKLLMTEQLYRSTSLFVRELLQNALDALRHRGALYTCAGIPLPGLCVKFEHHQESGVDIVRCVDNGSGMDEHTITKFLMKSGRSYYRSPEFEQERVGFREKGCDFDPCAQFGIGFMSCFMFGDDITIHTRRDYGVGREYGRSLIVEIRGLSGIVTIRPGSSTQTVGTAVEVRGRLRSVPMDAWSDPVGLIDVIEGFALAVEFPIEARCTIPNIAATLIVEPGYTARRRRIESTASVSQKHVFVGGFNDADKRLGGEVRLCTLVDVDGVPTTETGEASIQIQDTPPGRVMVGDGFAIDLGDSDHADQLCCDGILVAGGPGRRRRVSRFGWRNVQHGFGGASFLLDARGDLKPVLTPARTPPEDLTHARPYSWKRLFDVASGAYSLILEDIASRCRHDPERFWVVAEAYGLSLTLLRAGTISAFLKFPFIEDSSSRVNWISLAEIGTCEIAERRGEERGDVELTVASHLRIWIPDAVRKIQTGQDTVSTWSFAHLLAGCSVLRMTANHSLQLVPQVHDLRSTIAARTIGDRVFSRRYLLDFDNSLNDVIAVTDTFECANAEHAVTRRYRSAQHKRWLELSPLEHLLGRLVWGAVGNRFDDEPEDLNAMRIRRELGILYRAVNWTSVDDALKPPFAIFRPGYGIDRLMPGHLESWAELDPIPLPEIALDDE